MKATLYTYPAILGNDSSGRCLVHFPDLPEALTDGADKQDALSEATDCLSEALMSRIADGETIPAPSPIKHGQHQIAPNPTIALKAAVYTVAHEQGITAAELARRLKVDHKEARRLLDPRHVSKTPRLAEALKVMGHVAAMTVYDAANHPALYRR